MKDLSGKFSLRELLQIVIPGIYFIGLIKPILIKYNFLNIESSTEFDLQIIIYSLISILTGMIIYTFEIPKNIWFFHNNLPTSLIEKNLPNINDVHNKYFQFYDDKISDKQKIITEKYTSIFHFSVNIFVTSVLLLIVYIFTFLENFWISNGTIPIFIGLLSLGLSLLIFYGNRKIKYMFNRQYKKFEDSVK